MRRVLLAITTLLALGLCAQEKHFPVYKASWTQTYDYHFAGGHWQPDPDKYASYFVMEVTVDKGVTLNRVLSVEYWKGTHGLYYYWWVTTWFSLMQFGNGLQAIVAHDGWKGAKTSIETVLLTGASMDGPPKGYTGVHFTILPGSEVEREDVKMRLDTKLTAAAEAAAARATGDPLTAIRKMLTDYLESRGYEEDR